MIITYYVLTNNNYYYEIFISSYIYHGQLLTTIDVRGYKDFEYVASRIEPETKTLS